MKKTTTDDLLILQRNDFAPDFRWGCSTSSYQIEGAVHADLRGESIWDRFCATPGHIRDGSSGAVACDHYHHWPEDLDLARSLGTNAYRFSIAWPRIFTNGRGSVPNPKGLDFYSRLVDGMLERGLEPWVTLYHWDLPQALQDQGGWVNRDTIDAFVEYADVVSRHLGDRIQHWITHNEPWCTAFHGNYEGVHAPGLKDFKTALQVSHNVLVSHGLAIPVIRRNAPNACIGAALSLHPLKPASDSAQDLAATTRHDGLRNRWFLDPLHGRGYPADIWKILGANAPVVQDGDLAAIATSTDFLGVNYYFPEIVADAPGQGVMSTRVIETPNVERTAFGWEVSPEGMVALLSRVARDYQPAAIYLTENGSTYDDVVGADGEINDVERRRYLMRHIAAAREIVAQGIPVKGYFAWSLLDNFEWAEGYIRRFGLTHVDFDTQQRRLKASGKWYRDFLQGEAIC
ncbi:GH1 family beta-glucosidase [Rhodoferax sp.]|uniref:GH1 family beta-glucosidase n=1 Tax=Rhodoferax sp. TaxID=50421 RepID=UPI00260C4627|nr:GH1 family beta-glucosidase [Rhodoferax sp.]MDD2920222.1 GH1 family beta-glucosidase [Rhodoferax sp.]